MHVPLLRQVSRPDLLPSLIDGLFYFPIETHSSHLDSSPLHPSTSDLSVTSSRCGLQEEVSFLRYLSFGSGPWFTVKTYSFVNRGVTICESSWNVSFLMGAQRFPRNLSIFQSDRLNVVSHCDVFSLVTEKWREAITQSCDSSCFHLKVAADIHFKCFMHPILIYAQNTQAKKVHVLHDVKRKTSIYENGDIHLKVHTSTVKRGCLRAPNPGQDENIYIL